MKIGLIIGGIGLILAPIILAFGALAFAIKDLVKAFQNSENIANRVKKAFSQIFSLIKAILKPIGDVFNSFFGFNEAGKDANETFSRLAGILLTVIEKIGALSERLSNSDFIKNFQQEMTSGFTQVINILITVGVILKRLFGGGLDEAKSSIDELRYRLIYFGLNILESLLPKLKGLFEFIVAGMAVSMKAFIRIAIEAIKKIPSLLGSLLGPFGGFFEQIIDGANQMWSAISGKEGFWGGFKAIGSGLYNVVTGITAMVDPVVWYNSIFGGSDNNDQQNTVGDIIQDGLGIGTGEISSGLAQDIIEGISSGSETIDNIINDLSSGAIDAISGLIDKALGGVIEKQQEIADEFEEIFGIEITAPIQLVSPEATAQIAETVSEITRAVSEVLDTSGEELGEDFGNSVGNAIKDAMQKFVDLVVDYLANEITKVKERYIEILEKQKEESLSYFDDQIAAIDALEQAEEKLLRKEKQIAEDRKRMRDRELELENYRRDRALAIYEGRIDDARMLDLRQKKSTIDFNEETQNITEERAREAQREQRDTVREILKRQKEDAAEAFDEIIKSYKDFIENIGKYGTYTQEELQQQFQEIHDKSVEASEGMLIAFEEFFNEIPDLINEYTDPTVGFFSVPLDKLIEEARDKFGLQIGDQTRADTLLGVVGLTMNRMGDIFSQGVQTTTDNTVTELGNMATSIEEALNDVIDSYITPSVESMNEELEKFDPEGIMAAALEHANTTMLREYQKMVGHTASLVDSIAAQLDPLIQMYTSLEAAASSASGAMGGAGGVGGTDTGGPSALAPPGELSIAEQAGIRRFSQFRAEISYPNVSDDVLRRRTTEITNLISAFAQYMKTNPSENQLYNLYTTMTANKPLAQVRAIEEYIKQFHPQRWLPLNRKLQGFAYGGSVKMAKGGPVVPGFNSTAVPAILHGGEYVINSKAVSNIGMATLQSLNNMRFANLRMPKQDRQYTTINTTNTTHIYVDNFIGEEEWFQSMMKEYNVKVVPNNQKSAGLQSRTISTYNGINRGM